jgi:DNA-binding NarL/FixJ family response regulator
MTEINSELSSYPDCISVFLIDDHQVVIDGIRKWFRPSRDHIDIVGSSLDLFNVKRNGIPEPVDIIILDLYLKLSDPIVNFLYLKGRYPEKKIIIFSHEDDVEWQQKMYDLGASAYVLKSSSREELKHALEFVASGGRIFSFNIFKKDQNKHFEFLPMMIPDSLSLNSLEKEIIARLISGQYLKIIACETATKECTIRQILARLRKRFNAQSNTQLAIDIFRQSRPISSHSIPSPNSPDVSLTSELLF